MKKIFILTLFIFITFTPISYSADFEGGVITEGQIGSAGRIVDRATGKGIPNAKIILPKEQYSTQTDAEGFFELDTYVDGTSIMSINKENYKPYSVTINEKTFSAPLVIGIEKSNASDMIVDSGMYHLGDNNYSDLSANAGEFRMETIGPFYTKRFILKNLKYNKPIYIVIGSIIGIDSQLARNIGQNKISNAFASPPEVFFNGNKISEIQINGDGQRIRIPAPLIRKNQINEITIRTGRNLMQTAYIDYDDIEFMNIFVEN